MNVSPLLLSVVSFKVPATSQVFRVKGGRVYGALLAAMPLFSGVAHAQSPAPAPSKTTAIAKPAVNLSTYKLGAQDVIRVVVENYPNYSHEGVPVLPDGTVNLPFYGQNKVGGKTIPQVQAQLRAILAKRFRRPELLTVGIVSVRPPEVVKPGVVSVLGAVEKPGPVVIEKGFRLTQVLSNIGGIKGRLDEVQASLSRRGQVPIELDIATAMAQPSSAANVPMQDGDTLTIIATEPGRVVVGGHVLRPNVYEMHRTPRFGNELPLAPRLLDVLVAAGGVSVPDSLLKPVAPAESVAVANGTVPNSTVPNGNTPDNTAIAPVDPARFKGSLLRQGQTIPLRVGEALTAKDAQENPANTPILAGDFITIEYVPPKPPKPIPMVTVFVDGPAVRQPGTFTVQDGTRVLEVIARAGGLAKAEVARVSLRRALDGTTSQIDLRQALLRDDLQTNPLLKNLDFISVREPDTIEVRATGRFNKPDALQLPLGATLADAIAAAGDLTVAPDKARLAIVRRADNGDQKVLRIDAVALLREHDLAQNARLRNGDWISAAEIPEAGKQSVTLSGEIARPGAYEIVAGDGLAQLIARAGGVTGEALLADIIVERDGKAQSVDAYEALVNGVPLNFAMQDRDFVIVKKNPNRVQVLEAVLKPGAVIMPEKRPMTLLDALNQAGGMLPNANKKEVVLLRRLPEGAPLLPGAVAVRPEDLPKGTTGTVQAFIVALDKNAVAGAGIILQPGDMIYVPQKAAKSGFSNFLRLIPLIPLL